MIGPFLWFNRNKTAYFVQRALKRNGFFFSEQIKLTKEISLLVNAQDFHADIRGSNPESTQMIAKDGLRMSL